LVKERGENNGEQKLEIEKQRVEHYLPLQKKL
jgi:hypothetical protein